MKKNLIFILIALAFLTDINSQTKNLCLSFDGLQESKISSGNVAALNNTSAFTIEAWILINQWNEGAILFKKEGADWKTKISMTLGPDASKRIYLHVSNGTNTYMALDNSSISVNKWHHVAVVYKGDSTEQLTVFIDGEQSGNKWYSTVNNSLPSTTPTTNGNLEIGSRFNGQIDEFRVWNTSLTAEQLDFNNTINKYHQLYDKLKVYYRGDQDLLTNIYDYTGNYHARAFGNVAKNIVSNNPNFKYRIVSSYVRQNRFQTGQISDEYLHNNNDLLFIGTTTVKKDGGIYNEYPDNDGVLSNVNYLDQFDGRSGVLQFNGQNSKVNCGEGLLYQAANVGAKQFTFEAWVYIDEWVEGSFIFHKTLDWLNKTSLSLGTEASKSINIHVNNGTNTYAVADNKLSTGKWHHIAVAYNGSAGAFKQFEICIDAVPVKHWFNRNNGLVATNCPKIEGDFIIGENFKGKIDEIRLWKIAQTPEAITKLMYKKVPSHWWEYSLLTGYWQVNNRITPAKDIKNIKYDLQRLKQAVKELSDVQVRFSIMGKEQWKEMIKTSATRETFANNVKTMVETYELDGIDLDFEWCESPDEWANYSKTIEAIDAVLPADKCLSVSLHSFFYKLSQPAIDACDFISIQVYGPQNHLFPYERTEQDFQTVTNYGIPANKLVIGLPFYGNAADHTEVGYNTVLKQIPDINPEADEAEIIMNDQLQKVIFNGQKTIIKKTLFARNNNCAGVMYWDSATDLDYNNSKCLLRGLNTIINANVDSTITQLELKGTNQPTSITNIDNNNLTIYPNHANQSFSIDSASSIKQVRIINQNGETVFNRHYSNVNHISNINVSALSGGLYIVKATLNEGKAVSSKLMINHN
ncbi:MULTISPECIES: LamG-like jellyroll fold domain-containing protein [unclassified Carboxylicivirga]|uniref:LamG-like jellyroll fold domain-containing protein n=1 Tax=Carboxylicivirga TaxID=1628153 RepID=UPI003D357DEF